MKDQVLSIERMQYLKELGVDISKSSLFWVKKIINEIGEEVKGEYRLSFSDRVIVRNFELWNIIPAFTLDDVLDLIPKNIITNDSHRDKVYFVADFSEKVMGYAYRFETCGEISYYRFFSWVDNIIDAAYEMLCWCIYEGYIKTNKED